MTSFDPAQHRRDTSGRFAPNQSSEADANILGERIEDTMRHLEQDAGPRIQADIEELRRLDPDRQEIAYRYAQSMAYLRPAMTYTEAARAVTQLDYDIIERLRATPDLSPEDMPATRWPLRRRTTTP